MEQRVIKFRAWDGTFMMDPYCELREHNQFWGEDLTNTPYKSPISVMQFTGLHDKNGKEIYEGDVLKYDACGDVSHHRIYFHEESGRWMDERYEDGDSVTVYDSFEFVRECKIIGNIHQNPELLK